MSLYTEDVKGVIYFVAYKGEIFSKHRVYDLSHLTYADADHQTPPLATCVRFLILWGSQNYDGWSKNHGSHPAHACISYFYDRFKNYERRMHADPLFIMVALQVRV